MEREEEGVGVSREGGEGEEGREGGRQDGGGGVKE